MSVPCCCTRTHFIVLRTRDSTDFKDCCFYLYRQGCYVYFNFRSFIMAEETKRGLQRTHGKSCSIVYGWQVTRTWRVCLKAAHASTILNQRVIITTREATELQTYLESDITLKNQSFKWATKQGCHIQASMYMYSHVPATFLSPTSICSPVGKGAFKRTHGWLINRSSWKGFKLKLPRMVKH